jgi:hypothetical protein
MSIPTTKRASTITTSMRGMSIARMESTLTRRGMGIRTMRKEYTTSTRGMSIVNMKDIPMRNMGIITVKGSTSTTIMSMRRIRMGGGSGRYGR